MGNTGTVLAVILIVVLVLLLFGGVGMMGLGGFGMMGPGMMGGYGGYGMHGFGTSFGVGYTSVGAILALVFWALIIAGVVLLVAWLFRSSGAATPAANSAMELLKARYAKGEITKEQFDAIKRDLQ
jgi:putative membrane protein